jgi:hypothetical protein
MTTPKQCDAHHREAGRSSKSSRGAKEGDEVRINQTISYNIYYGCISLSLCFQNIIMHKKERKEKKINKKENKGMKITNKKKKKTR